MIDYTKRFDLMGGKRILYVHGFASSGATGTAKSIRQLLPDATVISPDLPLHPADAMRLLHDICDSEHPDLIIGTSMGGMYTEMLRGFDRICVNPAFRMAETMMKNNGLGRHPYNNPREDGETDFLVTKSLVNEFKDITSLCFSDITDEDKSHVYGLFGRQDTLVDTFDLFSSHYPNAIRFDGVHQLNDESLMHSVIPVIKWIDDRQNSRERPVLYITLDDTLRTSSGKNCGQPLASAVKAFNFLNQIYDVYIVSDSLTNSPDKLADDILWADRFIGVSSWNRVLFSSHRNILYGDYLIGSDLSCGSDGFIGTFIQLGSEQFKTWEDIIVFFQRLGGQ